MCTSMRGHPGARFKSAPPKWGTMPCLWEQFRFCHKTFQPLNKRLEVTLIPTGDLMRRVMNLLLLAVSLLVPLDAQTYEPTWDSVDTRPIPTWLVRKFARREVRAKKQQ